MMQANTGVRFETKDPLLSQLVKQAEEKCRLNIKNFGGDPVLVEGGGYEKIWLETHKTVFFITHSVEEAVYLGDRVVVLSPKTCSIRQIFDVPLERPRHIYAPEFVELRHQILDIIKGENTL